MSAAMTWKETDIDTIEKRGKNTVSVIGCGRTGLSTACLFASANFRVIGVDSNQYIINLIKKGKIPSGDPKFAELTKKHLKEGRIAVTNQTREAASKSDIVIFAVPPFLDQKKKPDYSNIEKACKEAGIGLLSGSLVIVESTVGPGVTETLLKETLEKSSGLRAGIDFGLAYIFMSASSHSMFQDFSACPKVIGAINEKSLNAVSLVFKWISNAETIKVSNIKTAEAISLFENVYRDVNQALANELALFSEKAGIDFFESQKALNSQHFSDVPVPDIVGWYFSTAPHMLFEEAENINAELHLSTLARKINAEMLSHTLRLTRDVLRSCGKTVRRARISVFGVSSRPDIRETDQSFVKHLVTTLNRNGARVSVYDPLFSYKQLLELDYPVQKTLRKAVEGADCLILTVGHDRLKGLRLNRIKFFVRKPAAIVDLAHVFNPSDARKEGFAYRGLGRG